MNDAHIGSDSAPEAQSGMDEILASIREIIAEEPLSYRHRRSGRDEPVAEARSQSIARSVMRDPAAGAAAVGRERRAPTPPSLPKGTSDPLLDELLDRGLAGAAIPAGGAPVTADTPLALPENEVKTAADVLGALALGLATTHPSRVPVETAVVAAAVPATASVTPPLAEPVGTAIAFTAADEKIAALPPVLTRATVAEAPVIRAAGSVAAGAASSGRGLVITAPPLAPVVSPSFEDTIATMLRPLLREWLDANMPRMVEKALREELGTPAVKAQVANAGAVLT